MEPAFDRHDEDLAQVFASLYLPVSPEQRSALVAQVCLFTEARREAGWSAERILIALKRHAMHAQTGMRRRTPPHDWRSARIEDNFDAMLSDVIHVCIQRYYEDTI